MSDKIKAHHVGRKAVLYVRQSSHGQVTQNQESQRLQYAMEQRLRELGWSEVELIDEDLGRSASGFFCPNNGVHLKASNDVPATHRDGAPTK